MRTPIQRLRHFGWPMNDQSIRAAGAEANGTLVEAPLPVRASALAESWMDGNTHDRPFFAYRQQMLGDPEFKLVGFGAGRAKSVNHYGSAIFANPITPARRLTALRSKPFPTM